MKIPMSIFALPGLGYAVRMFDHGIGATVLAIILKFRRPLIVTLDLILIVLANYLAFWLRKSGTMIEYVTGCSKSLS